MCNAQSIKEYKIWDWKEIPNTGKSYLNSRATITFYIPENYDGKKAVLICPGGGYNHLATDHEGKMVANWLNENGIAGVVLKYRHKKDHAYPEPIMDAQHGMRMTRKYLKEKGFEPKVGVLGFSAGGHLASSLSTHYNDSLYYYKEEFTARPDFSILIYPVISFQDELTHNGSRNNFIGDKNDFEKLKEEFSNEKKVDAKTPPTILFHSTDDKAVVVENSLEYYKSLKKNNVSCAMHIFPTGGHGYGMRSSEAEYATWPELCLKWIKNLKFN